MYGYVVEDDKRFIYLKKLLEDHGDFIATSLLHYQAFDYIVFGLRGPDELGHYKENNHSRLLSDDFFQTLKKGCRIYTFVYNAYLDKVAKENGLVYMAFENNQQIVEGNANLTSEAVLAYLICNRPTKLKDSTVTIMGYGNLAKSLITYFKPFAKELKIVCRNPKYDEEIKKIGISYRFEDDAYLKSDILINTVPHRLFTKDKLKKIDKNTIFLDVSSFPYSFDIDDVLECRINAYILPGLPSKYAYQDAAKLLLNMITEGKNV